LGIALQVGTALVAAAVVGSVTQTVVQLDSEGTAGETIRNLVPWALYNLLPILGVLIVLAASLLAARAGLRLLGAGFAPAFLGVGMVLTGMVGHALSTIEAVGVRGTVLDEGTGLYAAYGLALVAWGGVVGLQGGRRIAVRRAVLVTGIGFVGTVLSSLPMYVAGFMDQPSWDSVDYDSSGAVALLNGASAAGHVLVALAALAAVAAVVRSKGDAA
jgi:cytochrome o ubiquinol oxidase subunit 1